MSAAELNAIHRPEAQRFEIRVDAGLAYEAYSLRPGVIVCEHTEVPEALGGRGIGSALARQVLEHAAAQGLKVDPQCPFVRAWIDRHPAYHPLSLAHGASA